MQEKTENEQKMIRRSEKYDLTNNCDNWKNNEQLDEENRKVVNDLR